MMILLWGFLISISFRFFSFIILSEMIMVMMIFRSLIFMSSQSSIFPMMFLVLGACEVGLALSLIVKKSRFKSIEKMSKISCEGF